MFFYVKAASIRFNNWLYFKLFQGQFCFVMLSICNGALIDNERIRIIMYDTV